MPYGDVIIDQEVVINYLWVIEKIAYSCVKPGIFEKM